MSSAPPYSRRFPFMHVGTGTSKAQAGLAKIICIISTVPPPPSMEVSHFGSQACADAKERSTMPAEKSANLDLRLGLSLQASQELVAFAPETGVNDQNSTAHSGVFDSDGADSGIFYSGEVHTGFFYSDGARSVDRILQKKRITLNEISQEDCASDDFAVADKSSEGECSPKTKPVERRSMKISEVTCATCKDEKTVGGRSEASVNKGKEYNGEGYLDLLLDAALMVSTEGWNHVGGEVYGMASTMTSLLPPLSYNTVRKKRSSSCEMHRSKRAMTSSAAAVGFKEYEKTEPIIRSKRGRTLVLPSRYRDSILEPWKKASTVQRR